MAKMATSVDWKGQEMYNALFHILSAHPTSYAIEGRFYWNSTEKKLYVHNGTGWQELGSGGIATIPVMSPSIVGGAKLGTGSALEVNASDELDLKGAISTLISSAIQGLRLNGTLITPDSSQIVALNDLVQLVGGKIPTNLLPESYNKDTLHFDTYTDLPNPPSAEQEEAFFYVKDTNIVYIWGGSDYVKIAETLEYATDAEAQAGLIQNKIMSPHLVRLAIQSLGVKTITQAIGDGSTLVFDITHNLSRLYPVAVAYDTISHETALVDFEAIDPNTLRVKCTVAPATNEITVVIMG